MRASALISLASFLVAASAGTAHLTAAPVKRAPITVSLSNLGCSTDLGTATFEARSWSWGAASVTAAGSGSGSGAGKPVVNELLLTRAADSCSPALLGGVVSGKIFGLLTLSQYDQGGDLKATVVLNNPIVTKWEIGGTTSSAEAIEQVAVSFDGFSFTDAASGAKVCYDVKAQKLC